MATWKKLYDKGMTIHMPHTHFYWAENIGSVEEYVPIDPVTDHFVANCRTALSQISFINSPNVIVETGNEFRISYNTVIAQTWRVNIEDTVDKLINISSTPAASMSTQIFIYNNCGSNASDNVNVHVHGSVDEYWPGGLMYKYNTTTRVNGAVDIITASYDAEYDAWYFACVPNYRRIL